MRAPEAQRQAPLTRLGLCVAALVACQPSARPDAGTDDAPADASPFVHLVPASATLPGDFAPPKDPVITPPAPPAAAPWFGFEPYPGAELLCAEQVATAPSGKLREIHWASYGTTSPAAEVTAYYKRRDAGAFEVDRDEATLAQGKSLRLSVVRLPTPQPFPRCERGPKPTHRAVIVVTRAEAR